MSTHKPPPTRLSHLRKPTGLSLPALFTCFYLMAMFLPRLIPVGMFLDGMTYASISRNMAIGVGSFWQPYFSSTFWLPYHQGEVFYEHPPLMFGLQALLFRLLGDHHYVEKLYCLLVLLATLGLMRAFWRSSFPAQPANQHAWLPLLLWYSMPVVIWAAPNNLLDSNVAVFGLLAVWLIYEGMQRDRWALLALAGICVWAAALIKGPVGMFPLAGPVLYLLAWRPPWRWRYLGYAVWPTLVFAGCMLLLWQHPPAREFLTHYLQQQVWGSLSQAREVNPSAWGRWYLLRSLFIELLPALLLSAAGWWWLKRRQDAAKLSNSQRKMAVFFLLTALSASLPLMLSVKQSTFYLLPSLPFYALALACFTLPVAEALSQLKLPQRYRLWIRRGLLAAMLAVGLYALSLWGVVGRPKDRKLVLDMREFAPHVPAANCIATCPALMENGALHAHLMRFYRIELCAQPSQTPFYLYETRCGEQQLNWLEQSGYSPLNPQARQYYLYMRK